MYKAVSSLFRTIILSVVLLLLLPMQGVAYDFFTDAGQWDVYDPRAGGFQAGGFNAQGMWGGAFDGRYIYRPGGFTGSGYDGEVMRYDTQGDFATQGSWEIIDPTAIGVAVVDTDEYRGAIFDGRYVYFVPYAEVGNSRHGRVLRYDTQGDFDDSASYEVFNMESANAGAVGYTSGTFDGRYVYFAHTFNDSGQYGGIIARFDTQDDFTDSGSWTFMDRSSVSRGFYGATFDGRYVYFGNRERTTGGDLMRYDTQGTFTNPASWENFSTNTEYGVPFYDGRYVYYPSLFDTAGQPLQAIRRYDTQGSFTNPASWTVFDADAELSVASQAYAHASWDGRYIYFAPFSYATAGTNSEILKYDTYGDFADAASWSVFDMVSEGVIAPGLADANWAEALFDGVFMYFFSWVEGTTPYATIVRFSPAKTTGAMYPRVDLSNPGVNATNVQYDLTLRPLTPWADGSKVLLTFPDEYDTFLDTLTGADVSATGTHIASTSTVIDPVARQIQVTFTTTNSNAIVSDVTISIGDGGAGGLNDLTNPATAGVYAVDIAILDAADSVFASSAFLVGIDNSLEATAHVVAAILLTLDKTSLQFSVDPATNNGEDLSQYNELTVSSNAGGGYVIYGGMRDAQNQLQFSGSNGGAILPGLGENTMSYEAHNGAYDSGEAVNGTHSFQSTSGAALTEVLGGALGYNATTNQQLHTIYYDVNVDFLLPSGIYTGELVYTVIPTF